MNNPVAAEMEQQLLRGREAAPDDGRLDDANVDAVDVVGRLSPRATVAC